MEDMVEEFSSQKRQKRKTVLSKLATSRDHVTDQSTNHEAQLQLAKDLERQNLNGGYHSAGFKDPDVEPATRPDDKGSGYSRRKLASHVRRGDVEVKAEKRSRESQKDSSGSDAESSRYHIAKRHSESKLLASDEEETKLPSQSGAIFSQPVKDFGLHINSSNSAMDIDDSEDASLLVNDDLKEFRESEVVALYRKSLRKKDDSDKEDEEEKDLVPEMNRNYSSKNANLQPVITVSSDFKLRPDWSSGVEAALSETGGSEKSFASSSVLSLLTTEKARQRSFLVGSMSASCSFLGSEALERLFPERKMRVFIGTWNMCEMKNVPPSVDDFLLPKLSEYVQDAYVIGTQETASNRYEWELKLQETLGPEYVMFHSSLYGTLHLAIFLRRDLIWFCSVSEEASVTTRPGPSSVKTKGAVAVCFTFFATSFLFINSHFTAHDGRSQERVEDFHKIISGLSLPKIVNCKSYSPAVDDVSSRFECVFWMGDLNCRLERDRVHLESVIASLRPNDSRLKEDMDVAAEVMKSPDAISYKELLQHDELKRLIDEALAFKSFQEGRIKFLPTYKYDIGTDDFDTSKKNRIPSYTDRILFRSRQKNAISCLLYQSASTVRDSDHKPVYGLYEVSIRPGMDNIPLSGGQFNREVWLEGNKRRAMKMTLQHMTTKSNSTVCSVM